MTDVCQCLALQDLEAAREEAEEAESDEECAAEVSISAHPNCLLCCHVAFHAQGPCNYP